MFAVIETGGKQYLVEAGQKIKIEKLTAKEGETFDFDKVLLIFDKKGIFELGKPYLSNKKVSAKVLKQRRAPKVIVFKYHSKTRYRKKKGHRQHYSEAEILGVK